MSYYPNHDGLRCDRCLRSLDAPALAVFTDAADLCAACAAEASPSSKEHATWLLTLALGLVIIGALLWVLYSLPPTFD